jgi:hypothetical protein
MKSNKVFVFRKLHWSSKQLVAQISVPMPENQQTDWPRNHQPNWYCWVDIKLIPGKRVHHERVVGIDSWQAVENAMWLVQKVIQKSYAGAYAFEPEGGPFFAFLAGNDLPMPDRYNKVLYKHVENEFTRKKEELWQKFRRCNSGR